MKSLFALIALFSASAVLAEDTISYRDNDPFVFCTYGQKTPTKCWWPMSPAEGTIVMDPTCFPPNRYGRDWTKDDWASLAEYERICPRALGQGTWKGPGTGQETPFVH